MRWNRLLFVGALAALLAASPALGQDAESESPTVAPSAETPPAAEASPPATAPAAAPAAAPATAGYDLQLRELEDRLNELKEGVFASKARLRMLWQQLMQGRVGGSRVIARHVNELGSMFEIVRVTYSLDGAQFFDLGAREDSTLNDRLQFDVYDESVLPGPHTIFAQIQLRGASRGLFSYMAGYEFTLRSSYTFTLEEGKTARVSIVLYDRGGMATSIEERPDVRFGIEVRDSIDEALQAGDER